MVKLAVLAPFPAVDAREQEDVHKHEDLHVDRRARGRESVGDFWPFSRTHGVFSLRLLRCASLFLSELGNSLSSGFGGRLERSIHGSELGGGKSHFPGTASQSNSTNST